MDVNTALVDRHSEDEFAEQLRTYVDSGASVIHVRTREIMRAALALRKVVLIDGFVYNEWDIVNGFRQFSLDNMFRNDVTGDSNGDLMGAFAQPMAQIKDLAADADVLHYFVYLNPQAQMDNNPYLTQLVLQYAHALPATNVRLVLVTPDAALPEAVGDSVVSIPFSSPGLGELRDSLNLIVQGVQADIGEAGISLDADEVEKVCFVGAGMAKEHFDMYASRAIVRALRREDDGPVTVSDVIAGVAEGKTEVVNKNDILELYPSADMASVGGMQNLKAWVSKRAGCYSDAAREFGIEPPKGMVFVGPPGTGKSLAAKAVSGVLGVPLVRLDFGRVFNSLVGASEERIRTALKMVESMAPVVLFADEIDKGLGGIGGSGDSGTSSRVLGSFLTWLQDCRHPVFTMVTANNVEGLPPELLRRGRFDAIFSTSLPTASERREVLRIHLGLRGRDINDYPKDAVDAVITASNGYVPAEIESAVKDGLIDAFSDEVDFGMEHVVAALETMVPLSRSFAAQIEKMVKWSKNNATPASTPDTEQVHATGADKPRTRVSARVRK